MVQNMQQVHVLHRKLDLMTPTEGNDAIAWRALPAWAGEALLELQRSEGDG